MPGVRPLPHRPRIRWNRQRSTADAAADRPSPTDQEFAIAVRTRWDIDHACGHTVEADLIAKPADQRARFARWLATRDCTACWRSANPRTADRSAWLSEKRATEQAEAETWARRFSMPPLDGPTRALDWGARCRHQLVTAAYTALVVEGSMDDETWHAIEDAARTITRAGWWIDQREADPADLPELLDAATSHDRTNENPY